jgi:hypothetical protein
MNEFRYPNQLFITLPSRSNYMKLFFHNKKPPPLCSKEVVSQF